MTGRANNNHIQIADLGNEDACPIPDSFSR
jgi:hypothetical protein